MKKYDFKTTSNFDEDCKEVRKKHEIIRRLNKKMGKILENPYIFKPLRNVLKNKRRTHIANFVLIFEILEKEKVVVFHTFKNHDDAYKL